MATPGARQHSLAGVLASLVAACCCSPAAAALASEDTTPRLVVRFQGDVKTIASLRTDTPERRALMQQRLQLVQRLSGRPLSTERVLASGSVVYQIGEELPLAQARLLAAQMVLGGEVLAAEPDVRVKALADAGSPVRNDPGFARQWPLLAPGAAQWGGADFTGAWALAGSTPVTVAVLDSGLLPSAELAAVVLPGYDMVADDKTDGDGTPGRDADPSDPGDSCDALDERGNVVSRSPATWHGTRVAGLIAALGNNGYGVAGAAPNALVVPVRVLGRCTGWMSDIADGVAWAVGKAVPEAPLNAMPARVINLSLGSSEACPDFMQRSIDEAVAAGAVVVAAAGNGGGNRIMAPASCANVVVVGAHTRSGDLAYYSNFGPLITLTAPAGGVCAVAKGSACQTDPTTTIGNLGQYAPGAENPEDSFSGTSAAAPHVSAAVALLLSVRPEMHQAEVVALLKRAARPAPEGTFCASAPLGCGGGLLDARQTLAMAQGLSSQPFVSIAAVAAVQPRNTELALAATAVGATDFTYTWRQVAGAPVTQLNPGSATLRLRTAGTSGLVSMVVDVQSASQPQLTASGLVSFIVDEPPWVPGGTLVAEVGKSFRHSLGIVDPENTPVQVAALGPLPDGARLVFDNGWQLEWDQPVAGARSLYLSAVDGQGQVAGNTYVLEARNPVVAAGNSGGGTAASASGTTTTASGGGGALSPWWALGLMCGVLGLWADSNRYKRSFRNRQSR